MDPGTSNLGLVLLDLDTKKVVRSGTYSVGAQQLLKKDPDLTIASTANAVRHFLCGTVPTSFVTERNLAVPNGKMLESQVDGMLGFFTAFRVPHRVVLPRTWRAYFGFPCNRTRAENKKDIDRWLEKHNHAHLPDDHQRDAHMIALWYAFSQQ